MYGLLYKKNILKIFTPCLLFVGLSLAIVGYSPTIAFAAPSDSGAVPTITSTGQSGQTGSTDKNSDVTCAIEKMGWILCPIIETSGKVGDQAFNFLANNFLQTEPELISNSPSGTKAAWELARNLANIMFIIAFLIIILSQVTGQGLNNYGVKKMLPRLVVAAIAVNVSYYICQLLVDLTNILGYELQRFMVNTAAEVSNKAAMPVQTSIDNQTSNGTLGAIAVGVLGLATAVWFLLPMLFLGIGTVVVTCIVIIIILLLRKAFIVLLVVVSPIAFVAYILPNTEKLFQKWGRMFWQLLLVFPIVGMLFGAGQLASAVILVAGSSANTYKDKGGQCIQLPASKRIDQYGSAPKTDSSTIAVKPCNTNGGSTPFLLGLVAAGIAVAPMLAVWAVLKGALSAAGAIGGKISGAVQNAGNKAGKYASIPEDKLKKRMGQNLNSRWQNMQARGIDEKGDATNMAGRFARKRALRERRLQLAKGDLERNQGRAIASVLSNPDKATALTSNLSTQGAKLATQSAIAEQDKVREQETYERQAQLQNMLLINKGSKDARGNVISDVEKLSNVLEEAIQKDDSAGVKAATNLLMAQGGPGKEKIRNAMAKYGTESNSGAKDFRYHITTAHSALKSSDADVYAAAADDNATEQGRGLSYHSSQESTFSGLTDDELSRQSKFALRTAGASSALRKPVTIVDQQGKAVSIARGLAVLASTSKDNIKDDNKVFFSAGNPNQSNTPKP